MEVSQLDSDTGGGQKSYALERLQRTNERLESRALDELTDVSCETLDGFGALLHPMQILPQYAVLGGPLELLAADPLEVPACPSRLPWVAPVLAE